MAGQVQMVYVDPPYGIEYGSNFQPFVNRRTVKNGKDEDLTQEPEMIRAFRDAWELDIHSYLTYLRDRLLLCSDLLATTGSVFVQIIEDLAIISFMMPSVPDSPRTPVRLESVPTFRVADHWPVFPRWYESGAWRTPCWPLGSWQSLRSTF